MSCAATLPLSLPADEESGLLGQRGSVLIAGLFAGIILVLCGLHVIGVTKAILIRALGQNMADAIALESSVWHAQGMNLIVLINLMMAGAMALLVTIRLVQIVLITAIALLTLAAVIASIFSGGQAAQAIRPWIQRFAQQLVKVQRLEDKLSPKIGTFLVYAAEGERLIAAVMPYVALARPITRTDDVPGLVVGVSLVPAWLDQKFSKFPQIPGLGTVTIPGGWKPETSFPARMGTLPLGPKGDAWLKGFDAKIAKGKNIRPGLVTEAVDLARGIFGSLPVQEEDFYQLCGRAGEMVVTFFPAVVGMDDAALEKLGAFAGVVFGSLQTMTCTPLKQLGQKMENEIRSAADQKCVRDEEQDIAAGKDEWDKKKREKCREDEIKKAKKDSGYTEPQNFDSLKVARLWGIIQHPKASPWLHVWGIVPLHPDGPKSRFFRDMKNLFGFDLDTAGVQGATVADPSELDPANAMGEFRHVCDGGPDPAQRSCAENSMWRPGWFAKLVPVRDITDEIRQKLGDAMAGWFSRFLGKGIASATDRYLQRFVPAASKPFITVFERHLGITLGQRMLNNWFNRRFLTGIVFTRVNNVEFFTAPDYPEHLH
ncbi:MAG: hypothetical protein ABW321_13840 [Polyangiales bacterium]